MCLNDISSWAADSPHGFDAKNYFSIGDMIWRSKLLFVTLKTVCTSRRQISLIIEELFLVLWTVGSLKCRSGEDLLLLYDPQFRLIWTHSRYLKTRKGSNGLIMIISVIYKVGWSCWSYWRLYCGLVVPYTFEVIISQGFEF